MAKSLKDSMKELEEMNNAKIMSDDITAYSLEAASFPSPVVDNEATVSTYTNTTLPYSEKYIIYNEYVDEKISTIDENKNIELDESQVNLTQEENSQYVRFKMFRRYDGVDQLNMTLLMHAVTPDKNDVYINPVNVQYDDNYLYFGVILPKSVCAVKGTVQFEIQAIGVNEKGDAYTLKTRKAEFNVEESLSGNGTVEPGEDTGWITTFLQQVTEKVREAQTAANEAKASANSAESSATTAQKTVNTAKTELTNTVNSTIKTALTNYYNKKEIDDQFANIDLSDVYDKINSIDGLAKFNVTYTSDTYTLSFYNGDKKIKDVVLNSDPSATWVTAYGKVVDKKITDAITPVSKSLNDYKTKTDADLSAIHKNIDNLPDTLKTKYYDKEAMNDLLGKKASNSDVESLTTKVGAVEQVTNSNKTSISTMGNKIASLEDAIGKIDVEPGKTYEATYDTESGNYTLWEITNEGETNEERTIKSQFKIVGGSGGGSTSTTLKIEYVTKSPVIVSRLSNARPASDVSAWAKASSKPSYSKSEVGLGNVDNTADANKSVKYATSAGSASSASKATGLVDYNATRQTIQIGYGGSGISGDAIKFIAGYTTGNGSDVNAKIKDVSKDALKSWLGLGSLAYSSATIPTIPSLILFQLMVSLQIHIQYRMVYYSLIIQIPL